MKDEKREVGDAVMELEVTDLGDAAVETKQIHPVQMVKDSCCTWSYIG